MATERNLQSACSLRQFSLWPKTFLLAALLLSARAVGAEPEIRLSLDAGERAELLTTDPNANPASILVNVAIFGGGLYNWTITADCNWLTIDPDSGSSSGQFSVVHIGADVSQLPAGGYVGHLSYQCDQAVNSPVVVPVYLYCRYDTDGVLSVPAEYPTIQAAVDAADNGDTVLVADGIYTGPGNRDIHTRGFAVNVRSENGPTNCIIDCNATIDDPHRAFLFIGGSNDNSVPCSLEGFTIKNAYVGKDPIAGESYFPQGGALFCSATDLTVANCVFASNRGHSAGAILGRTSSTLTVRNCSFYGNTAQDGAGGIYLYNMYTSNFGQVHDCIFLGNGEPLFSVYGIPSLYVYTSIVTSDWWLGGNNYILDPCEPVFVDAEDGDFHLLSQAGRWSPADSDWVTDDVTSFAVDAGDMSRPVGLEPFPNGGILNLGAYGGTAEASKSWFGDPVCQTAVAGDINGDCKVDFLDLRLMLTHWCDDNNS